MIIREQHHIQGQVQGVGFRPFIYKLAYKHDLNGFVTNNATGVLLEIEGNEQNIHEFNNELPTSLPPLAQIVSHVKEQISLKHDTSFIIQKSTLGKHKGHHVLISPDVALCHDCQKDIMTQHDRRYQYPFTNCTSCGPRYTITQSIPYDRLYTTMACFPMCKECQKEYDDPTDRRFHAQPNACAICGPKLWLYDKNNTTSLYEHAKIKDINAIKTSLDHLHNGQIIAIKSLGGFQLACDAYNENAIKTLRVRKNRPHKAFAIMVKDIETAKSIAYIGKNAEKLLLSSAAPIVLCIKKSNSLPISLAPDTHRIGIMLPYTPLHHILFHHDTWAPKALIMTSANAKGNPICIGNRQALTELEDIVDIFLFHDRDILIRVDDSVCLPLEHEGETSLPNAVYFRRARGYVPSPCLMPKRIQNTETVLGVGAFLKNTFCITKNQHAFVSQHIGDAQNPAVMDFFTETYTHLTNLLEVKPQKIVCDLHPDFPTTHFALDFAQQNNIPILRLPHHFAHIYAVLAEYPDYTLEPVLGLVLDGTGFGADHTSWGGELLYLDPKNNIMLRLGRLKPIPLPGGEIAIQEPWRIAHALYTIAVENKDIDESISHDLPYLKNPLYAQMAPHISELVKKNINCVESSGCGRLFDAVSALCGLCSTSEYEGQAAIRLENMLQNYTHAKPLYQCTIHEHPNSKELKNYMKSRIEMDAQTIFDSNHDFTPLFELDSYKLFTHLIQCLHDNMSTQTISYIFHHSLAMGFTDMIQKVQSIYGIKNIVLTGGVFNNETMLRSVHTLLKGYTVMTPKNIPIGDAGISLGQAFFGTFSHFGDAEISE